MTKLVEQPAVLAFNEIAEKSPANPLEILGAALIDNPRVRGIAAACLRRAGLSEGLMESPDDLIQTYLLRQCAHVAADPGTSVNTDIDGSYMWSSFRNAVVDGIRRPEVKNRGRGNLALELGEPAIDETGFEAAEISSEVQNAIFGLIKEHRQVVTLNFYCGLSYPEIAEALDIPLGTVKSRMFYAFRALREALQEYAADYS